MLADHRSISHGRGEYAVGEVHVNAVEGYFSILEREINGVYHHVSRAHLNRYPDSMRTIAALEGAEGRRLTYRATSHR